MLQVDLKPDALIDRWDAPVSEQLALISISVGRANDRARGMW